MSGKFHLTALVYLLAVVPMGCTHWPDIGTGGMAEIRPRPAPEIEPGVIDPDWQRVEARLRSTSRMLEKAVVRGAAACLPGHVEKARLERNRVVREQHGGLLADAEQTLDALRTSISNLERRLDNAKAAGTCRVGYRAKATPGETTATIVGAA